MMYMHHMEQPYSETQTENQADSASILEVCLCHHIRKTSRFMTRRYDQALKVSGLNFSKFNVLLAISVLEPVPAPEIAKYMALERTALNRNLKVLEERGLVQAEVGKGRRAKILRLSTAGINALHSAKPLWVMAQNEMVRHYGNHSANRILEIFSRSANAE